MILIIIFPLLFIPSYTQYILQAPRRPNYDPKDTCYGVQEFATVPTGFCSVFYRVCSSNEIKHCPPNEVYSAKFSKCFSVKAKKHECRAEARKPTNYDQAFCSGKKDGLYALWECQSIFAICLQGMLRLSRCPPGQVFKNNSNRCDELSQQKECNVTIGRMQPNRDPVINQILQNDDGDKNTVPVYKICWAKKNGVFGLAKCSNGFLQCTNEIAEIYTCKAGEVFNNTMRRCAPGQCQFARPNEVTTIPPFRPPITTPRVAFDFGFVQKTDDVEEVEGIVKGAYDTLLREIKFCQISGGGNYMIKNCSRLFVKCDNIKHEVKLCPMGSAYDTIAQRCTNVYQNPNCITGHTQDSGDLKKGLNYLARLYCMNKGIGYYQVEPCQSWYVQCPVDVRSRDQNARVVFCPERNNLFDQFENTCKPAAKVFYCNKKVVTPFSSDLASSMAFYDSTLPNKCKGIRDPSLVSNGRCSPIYYNCNRERIQGIMQCDKGKVFTVESGICVKAKYDPACVIKTPQSSSFMHLPFEDNNPQNVVAIGSQLSNCKQSGEYLPKAEDCRKFYMCKADLTPVEKECPAGTGWSQEKLTCDLQTNLRRKCP